MDNESTVDFGEPMEQGFEAVETDVAEEQGNPDTSDDMSIEDMLAIDYEGLDWTDSDESTSGEKLEVDLQNETVAETEKPKNDDARYEHWQSQYDKLKAEHEGYLKQTEHLKALDEAIRTDENLLGMLNDYLTKGSQQQQESVEHLKPPKDFDPYDAYNNPESTSYQWREKKEAYERQLLIEQARTAARNDVMQQLQAEAARVYQQQQEQVFRQQYKDVPDEKWNEFVQWSKNPNNVTMDALWKLYNLANTTQNVESNAKKQVQEQLKRTQGLPDSAAGINARQISKTKEEAFADSIVSAGNRGLIDFF